LNAMLALARRYWWLIAASAVGGGIAATALAAHQGKTYQAQAELLVRFGWEHLYRPWTEGAEGWQPARMVELVNAEVRLLNSRSVREAAIREIGVTTVYPHSADGQDVSDPAPGVDQGGDLQDDRAVADTVRLDRALAQAERDLAVRALGDSTTILLSFRHPDPEIARRVLAALIEAYFDEGTRVFVGDEPVAAALRLEQADARLEAAHAALNAYLAANDAVLLEQRLEAALNRARRLEEQALQAEALASGRQPIVDEINGWLDSQDREGGTATPCGIILSDELEMRLDADICGDALINAAGAPDVRVHDSPRGSGTELPAALSGLMRAELAGAQALHALAALEPEIVRLRRQSEQVAALQQVIDAAASTRRDALEKVARARNLALFAERGLQSVVVIDPPFSPTIPLGLGALEKLVLGALIGAVLGGCIALMADPRGSDRHKLA
jgi:hypothetical protein